MFAVGIAGIDLQDTKKWFEIYLERTFINNGVKTKETIAMQSCKK